jgi:hypothetical protein
LSRIRRFVIVAHREIETLSSFNFNTVNVPGSVLGFTNVTGVVGTEAVGTYFDATYHGFEDVNGVYKSITGPGAVGDQINAEINGVTSSGEIYGDGQDYAASGPGSNLYGFVYTNGVFTTIYAPGALSGTYATTVEGVSATGVIYGNNGYDSSTEFSTEGFTDTNGVIVEINPAGASFTQIVGIDSAGAIVGTYAGSDDNNPQGFIDSNGTITTIAISGSSVNEAVGVSAAGVVAGTYVDSSGDSHGYTYDAGAVAYVNVTGATDTSVNAISSNGEIVGKYVDSSGDTHGFIDIGGVISAVNVPGATYTEIDGVNSAGAIWGVYDDSYGTQYAFFATPAASGAGNTSTYAANEFSVSQVSVVVNSDGSLTFTSPDGADTLVGVTSITLSNATIAVSGDVLTADNGDGTESVSTFNVTGKTYTSSVLTYGADGYVHSALYAGVTNDAPITSYEYLYGGNNVIGTDEFATGLTGHTYTGAQTDYDGGDNLLRQVFTGVTGAGYSSYENDYVAGLFAGSKFEVTSVPSGASYSSYELDYDSNNNYLGDKFFFTDVSGQAYNNEEIAFNKNGALTGYVLTGYSDEPYDEIDLFYNAGTYTGEQVDYVGVTGASYKSMKVDTNASGALTAVEYDGVTGDGKLSSIEQNYSGGAITQTTDGYTDITGQSYNAMSVINDSAGKLAATIYDYNNGTTQIVGHENDITLPALGGESTAGPLGQSIAGGGFTITANGSGDDFVFTPYFKAATITDFGTYASAASPDKISLSTTDFASWDTLLQQDAHPSGANGVNTTITSTTTHDVLILDGVTTAQLANLSGDFHIS